MVSNSGSTEPEISPRGNATQSVELSTISDGLPLLLLMVKFETLLSSSSDGAPADGTAAAVSATRN